MRTINRQGWIRWVGCLLLFGMVFKAAALIDSSDVKMNADRVDFDIQTGVGTFEGNVDIQYQDTLLRSQNARLDTQRQQAEAWGEVLILDKNSLFYSDRVDYNFEQHQGDMQNALTMQNAWIVRGSHVERVSEREILVLDGSITLCHFDPPSNRMTARRIQIFPGEYMVARHVVFWLGPVPVLYSPIYKRRLDGEQRMFQVDVGRRSNFGFQLFTATRLPLSGPFDADLLMDWHQKRGVGAGVSARSERSQGWSMADVYGIQDKNFEPNRSTEEEGDLDRYRISFENFSRHPNFWTSKLDLNIFSDIDFPQDFFTSKYQNVIQQDNRFRLSKTTERYSTGLQVRAKLNDFYNVLERMPQLDFNWLTMEIVEGSNTYYESANQAVYLNQDYANPDLDAFSAFRAYTGHTLSHTRRFFGWLNFSPALTFEGMFYSESPGLEFVEVVLPEPDAEEGETAGEVFVTQSVPTEEGTLLRTSALLSLGFSTNAYKLFDPVEPWFGYERFRNTLTPQVVFQFRPEPNFENDEVYQFDEIDRRVKTELINLGIISRWQAKDGIETRNILNTRYGVDYDMLEREFGNFTWESQVRVVDHFTMDYILTFDSDDWELLQSRTDLSWHFDHRAALSLGYLHRSNASNIITPEVSCRLTEDLFLRVYLYYNEGQSLVEKTHVSLIKGYKSLDFAIHYQKLDFRNETAIYFSLAPKLLPSGGLRIRS